MGVLRVTVTAVLMLATAVSAAAQCVSDARTISTRQSVPNLVAGPLAWGNGILAVAKFDRPTRRIFVATYDHHFNPLSSDLLVSSDTPDGPLAIVFNGTNFGLFYRTRSSEQLVLQRIALTGEPVGTPIPVSSREVNFAEEVDVTWSPALDAYVVAATTESRAIVQVWVTILDRDGIVRRDLNTSVFAAQDEASLNVAVAEDGTIGVFYRIAGDDSIVYVRIPRNGQPLGDTIWSPGFDLQAVALGNRFHLVKSREFAPGQREIRWMAVDSAGRIVTTDRVLLHVDDLDVQPLALTTNGQELALSYRETQAGLPSAFGTFRLHRFAQSGATVGNSLFAGANPAQRFAVGEHDFVWTGSAYISTAVRAEGRELDSVLIRLCELRASIAVERHYFTNDDDITFVGAAEGGAPGYTYRWNPGNTSDTFGGQTFRYRFVHNGVYTVTLTVTDESGVSTTTSTTVRIVERKKRAVRK